MRVGIKTFMDALSGRRMARKGTRGMVAIERIDALPIDQLSALVEEATAMGFPALTRLVSEYQTGRNRFEQPGEAIFVAMSVVRIVGVCGLNRDPYLRNPKVGRVRHLYVASDYRRKAIGSRLVQAVIVEAMASFGCLRLRTGSPVADAFYRSLGFVSVESEPECTHQLQLGDEASLFRLYRARGCF
jgi:GNAT superfamily N-acetyltransferase